MELIAVMGPEEGGAERELKNVLEWCCRSANCSSTAEAAAAVPPAPRTVWATRKV
jgi:hypothetical protein